jgi:hypothetical protein
VVTASRWTREFSKAFGPVWRAGRRKGGESEGNASAHCSVPRRSVFCVVFVRVSAQEELGHRGDAAAAEKCRGFIADSGVGSPRLNGAVEGRRAWSTGLFPGKADRWDGAWHNTRSCWLRRPWSPVVSQRSYSSHPSAPPKNVQLDGATVSPPSPRPLRLCGEVFSALVPCGEIFFAAGINENPSESRTGPPFPSAPRLTDGPT